MIDINGVIEVVQEVDELMNRHIYFIQSFLSITELKEKCIEYEELKKSQTDLGFNIFALISDTYYKENFHSDIIAAFMDTKGKHNAGNEYLKIFIQLLNKLSPKLKIDIYDFTNTNKSITREKHRIDILIIDELTNKAIIIENKINNAGDTFRQLPKYVEAVVNDEGIDKNDIVAIVYLPLDKNKMPYDKDWTEEEKQFIYSKFVKLVAYDDTENDLYRGWLNPCKSITNEIEVKSILNQYSKLIQNLGGNIMNNILMETFYNNVIKDGEKFKTALSVKSMMDELPQYIAQRIVDEFINNHLPFKKLFRNNQNIDFGEGTINENCFSIRIICEIDKYYFKFWDDNYKENHLKYTERVIKFFGYKGFYEGNEDLVIEFKFKEEKLIKAEQDLIQFIRNFIEKFNTLPKDLFDN